MALFKCDACHHIQETSNQYIGKKAQCPKCKEKGTIYNTVEYVKEITEQYLLQKKIIDQQTKEPTSTKNEASILEVHDAIPIDDYDIHNTDVFSQKDHYAPIVRWFNQKHIQATVDPKMMDTRGYFDEVAIYMGTHYNTIGSIIQQIRYAQSKNYTTVKIVLSKYSKEEIKQILDFCKKLHQFTFIARYNHVKKDNIIYLTIQDIPRIKNFFSGMWMEWFVLIKLITFFKENNLNLPIVRGADLTFQNKEKNELDIFFLNNKDEPFYIECKTGEFRQDLNKYFELRKKLGIKKEHFLLCVFGLDKEQAESLTTMYEITLINESMLMDHIKTLF